MKILILKMQQSKSGIMFLPSFVGPEEEVVINLPRWANKIVIEQQILKVQAQLLSLL